MANKMLIDTTHPEETRVVVLRGNRVEEFDFESASRRQLRGNIYLAKVTRVEPSLQAAFVDYGGNRHGFLAFSEIHPDYYQIPVADRQALIAEEERAHRDAEDEIERRASRRRHRHESHGRRDDRRTRPVEAGESSENGESAPAEGIEVDIHEGAENSADHPDNHQAETTGAEPAAEARHEPAPEAAAHEPMQPSATEAPSSAGEPANDAAQAEHTAEQGEPAAQASAETEARADDRKPRPSHPRMATAPATAATSPKWMSPPLPKTARRTWWSRSAGADALEEVQERTPRYPPVLQDPGSDQAPPNHAGAGGEGRTRHQGCGADHLPLACRPLLVLMPNTARGGGISRKITSAQDRKKLKEIAQDLEVPEGMGVILRTAGANRTKTEVKRDFEYLLRLWETVRDFTLKSTAPTLVYEEGSLIKRSIRDLYNKDVEEILVAGEDGQREARDFMRMLMPSHAKNVKLYKDSQPIFTRYGIESQLDAMFTPTVQLRSGGYIVINQTEALVAIDVNSGRATREHHIEDTAPRPISKRPRKSRGNCACAIWPASS